MADCNKKKEQCLKKSNLLVYQQPTGQRTERKDEACSRKGVKIPICNPQPKQIKICTGAELRKMCPPNICPCEPVKRSRFGLLKLLGFGGKSALAAAAIYITYDMGIWGTTDQTQELYNTACHIFGSAQPRKNDKWDPPSCEAESDLFSRPRFNPYSHCEDPPIRAQETYLKFKECWNGAISAVFHGVSNFPDNILGRLTIERKKEDERPACVPYSQLDSEEQENLSKYK